MIRKFGLVAAAEALPKEIPPFPVPDTEYVRLSVGRRCLKPQEIVIDWRLFETMLSLSAGVVWVIEGPKSRAEFDQCRLLTVSVGPKGDEGGSWDARPLPRFPSARSKLGEVVGRIWRHAFKTYAVGANTGHVDGFEGIEQRVLQRVRPRTWGALWEALCVDGEGHRIRAPQYEAQRLLLPFLVGLTGAITERRSARFRLTDGHEWELPHAQYETLRYALELLCPMGLGPNTLTFEGVERAHLDRYAPTDGGAWPSRIFVKRGWFR
ncbi:MAG: hypothetical protein RMA76_34520 [Deltaproteobacteria bacterium]|jgi:hypothetical protein